MAIQLLVGALAVGAGLLGAGSQLYKGKAESSEAKYNAEMKRAEAHMYEEGKRVKVMQWDREISRAHSTLINTVAANGILMTGSSVAALSDMTTQMEFDKMIELRNLESSKQSTLMEAEGYQKEAKRAKKLGQINALTSILSAGSKLF